MGLTSGIGISSDITSGGRFHYGDDDAERLPYVLCCASDMRFTRGKQASFGETVDSLSSCSPRVAGAR